MWRDDPHFVTLKITPKMQVCQRCGCECAACAGLDGALDYQHRIEQLEQQVRDHKEVARRNETQLLECEAAAKAELSRKDEDLARLRDRYDRLMESHKKLSRLNQTLEDRLLTVVTKYEGQKSHLMGEITASHSKLEEAKMLVNDLEEENRRFKSDCTIAVQLLQTRPHDYVQQKIGSLPDDLKERLLSREELLQQEAQIEQQQKKAKPTLSVMPTFPPCAAMFHHHAGDASSTASEGDGSDSGGDWKRVCNRQLADLIAESSLRNPAISQMFVCARCGLQARLVHRAVQTVSPATSPPASARHVHRAFASSTVVSASPFSGAILDV